MTISWTLQGALIYAAMAEFVLAFLALALRRRRLGWAQYAAAFGLVVAAVVYRTAHTGHAPLQNLFEVFLVLAAMLFPLSLFGRFALGLGGEAIDAFLAAGLLVPAGWVFSAAPAPLPPALQTPLFIPHVTAYLLAYVILTKAAVFAGRTLLHRPRLEPLSPGEATYRLVCLGFPFLTAGLLLGALWGKRAWGDWWNWDPKELWSLATWLTYAAYFHVRTLHKRRLEALLVLAGFVLIVLTLLWANLARIFHGLHNYAT